MYDKRNKVTGDWRKLCNVKLLNVYYTVNIVSIRWAGRDHFGYLSIGRMIIVDGSWNNYI